MTIAIAGAAAVRKDRKVRQDRRVRRARQGGRRVFVWWLAQTQEDVLSLSPETLLPPEEGALVETREERDALGSAVARRAPTIRCESCGRDVELVVNPTTGRSYVYPMHVKVCASTSAALPTVRQRDTP